MITMAGMTGALALAARSDPPPPLYASTCTASQHLQAYWKKMKKGPAHPQCPLSASCPFKDELHQKRNEAKHAFNKINILQRFSSYFVCLFEKSRSFFFLYLFHLRIHRSAASFQTENRARDYLLTHTRFCQRRMDFSRFSAFGNSYSNSIIQNQRAVLP